MTPRKDPIDGWMVFQFVLSCVVGIWAASEAWKADPTNPANIWVGFIVGLLVTRAVMFLVVWPRFGWKAATSMRLWVNVPEFRVIAEAPTAPGQPGSFPLVEDRQRHRS